MNICTPTISNNSSAVILSFTFHPTTSMMLSSNIQRSDSILWATGSSQTLLPDTNKRQRFMLFFPAIIAAFVIIFSSTSALSADFQPNQQLTEKWVADVYQPAFHQFARAANQWAATSDDLCESTLGSKTYSLQTTFTELVADYARVEIFHSGPLHKDNIRNRLFYWPDKRRVGERQLRALLNDASVSNLSAQQLAGKSVAIQGFPALERLLFASNDRAVETAPECHVIKIIIQNIAAMATELDRTWQTDSDFVQAFLHPTAASPDFRNSHEVLRSVITEVVTGLDALVDRKLQAMLSADPKVIRTTPLWRSRRTVAMLQGNVAGIRSLLFDSGFLAQIDLEAALKIDFDYVDHLLGKLKYTFNFADDSGQLTTEVKTTFASLSAVLNDIRHTIDYQILSPLGMSVNFNADDGD